METLPLVVPPLVWTISLVAAVGIITVDVAVIGRRPHIPSTAECLRFLGLYVGLAVAFGLTLWATAGGTHAGEFFAGWLTEYSLSVDNLFIFLLIMGTFGVPRQYQQKALMIGIILALVLRAIFIVIGAAAIAHFSWVFYVFGIFLIWTAVKVARDGAADDEGFEPPLLLRLVQKYLPSTHDYRGTKLTVVENGKRLITPMMVVLVALGATDLLFAVDSIPAIFGLTQSAYLVLMANVFALMGLRQLYFLLGGLLERLVYLSVGLAVLLCFIGVKLILEALHANELAFINGGEPVAWAPELPIWLSLGVIVGTLVLTAVASLLKVRWDERHATTPVEAEGAVDQTVAHVVEQAEDPAGDDPQGR